ncbi:MAG: hypothetical protein ABW178_11115 [Pseudoxanthomonas sp.]
MPLMKHLLLVIAGLYVLGLGAYLIRFMLQARRYRQRDQDHIQAARSTMTGPISVDAADGPGPGNIQITDGGLHVRVGGFGLALDQDERWLLSCFAFSNCGRWPCALLASQRFGSTSQESEERLLALIARVNDHLMAAGATALLAVEEDWVDLRARWG